MGSIWDSENECWKKVSPHDRPERAFPPPTPGTHFGACGQSRRSPFPGADEVKDYALLRLRCAQDAYDAYRRGYDAACKSYADGFNDCLRLHVRIG